MKNKLIILLLLLAGSIQTKAQKEDYIPLAKENAQWLVLLDYWDTPFPDEYYGYKIMGDTLINDTAYKKVYKREFESVSGDYTEPYEMVDEYLYAAVRDDIMERKVYGRGIIHGLCINQINKDYLMFDYNIQIGDTNNYSMCQIFDEYSVHNIYYGIFYDYYTKYFELETSFCYSYFMEGIGSECGLFEDVRCFEYLTTLERYCIGTDEECLDGFLVSVKETEKQNINIVLSPNPVRNFVNIKYPKFLKKDKIVISDISGKNIIIINKNIPEKIDVSILNKGLYFISFYIKNQLINTQKIIKN